MTGIPARAAAALHPPRRYNEITAYVVGLYVCAVALAEPSFREDVLHFLTTPFDDSWLYNAILCALAWLTAIGYFLAVAELAIRPFARFLRWKIDRGMDATVIVISNMVCGITFVVLGFREPWGWNLVFPILNAALIWLEIERANPDADAEMDPRRMQPLHALLATAFAAGLFAFFHMPLQPHWAVSISVACVVAAAAGSLLAAMLPLHEEETGEAG